MPVMIPPHCFGFSDVIYVVLQVLPGKVRRLLTFASAQETVSASCTNLGAC